jgi:hypothetical protein
MKVAYPISASVIARRQSDNKEKESAELRKGVHTKDILVRSYCSLLLDSTLTLL